MMPPEFLISDDGRHMAQQLTDGRFVVFRADAGTPSKIVVWEAPTEDARTVLGWPRVVAWANLWGVFAFLAGLLVGVGFILLSLYLRLPICTVTELAARPAIVCGGITIATVPDVQ